jgi:hypothetical protein
MEHQITAMKLKSAEERPPAMISIEWMAGSTPAKTTHNLVRCRIDDGPDNGLAVLGLHAQDASAARHHHFYEIARVAKVEFPDGHDVPPFALAIESRKYEIGPPAPVSRPSASNNPSTASASANNSAANNPNAYPQPRVQKIPSPSIPHSKPFSTAHNESKQQYMGISLPQ